MAGLSGILVWLWGSAALVFAMAIIGAVTRLTESGLSIMEWNVFAGTFPPLSQAEWDRLFEIYKLTPRRGQAIYNRTKTEQRV